MTTAAWITAATGLITAVINGAALIRHGRRDRARFDEHGQRLDDLETGKSLPAAAGVSRETGTSLTEHVLGFSSIITDRGGNRSRPIIRSIVVRAIPVSSQISRFDSPAA